MSKRKTINVIVKLNRSEARQVTIPYNIDEVELKARLRDLGFISSYRNSYLTTKVYLKTAKGEVEICKDECRSLKDLGIKKGSSIIIVPGEPEPRPVYRSSDYISDPISDSMKCLYGCPMAKSVEEAMNEAEKYSENDSVVTTGSIYEFN